MNMNLLNDAFYVDNVVIHVNLLIQIYEMEVANKNVLNQISNVKVGLSQLNLQSIWSFSTKQRNFLTTMSICDRLIRRWTRSEVKCASGKMSGDKMSAWRNVLTAKFPAAKCLVAKYPRTHLFSNAENSNVRSAKTAGYFELLAS